MFSRRERMLLLIALVAVAAAAAFQFVETSRAPSDGDGRHSAAQQRALEQRVGGLEERLAAETSPASAVVPDLLRAAQASSASTGMTVRSARPRRATKTPAGCVEHTVEIQVRGRFPDLAKFIFDLEEKNPRLRVARAAINAADAESDVVNCTIMAASYSPGEVPE